MDQLAERISKFKERLLDLSARNRLLNSNFKAKAATQFRVIDELPDELYRKLSSNSKMFFEPLPKMDEDPLDERKSKKFQDLLEIKRKTDEPFIEKMEQIEREEVENADEVSESALRNLKNRVRTEMGWRPIETSQVSLKQHAKRKGIEPDYDLPKLNPGEEVPKKWKDSKIQTLLLPDTLKRYQKNIKRHSDKYLKEGGVNPLHFAFGFLEWKASVNSERVMYAPLMLLQVSYGKDKNRRINVSGTGDSIFLNSTLNEKLKREFNCQLPSLVQEDEEEISLEDYLKRVDKEVAQPNNWVVKRWVSFGIFHTLNMPIYEDLKKIEDGKESSDLLKKMLVGTDEERESSLKEYDVDSEEIEEITPALVRPADVSQHSAVIDVLKGNNVVIKGPPGTGKSQTITNIISSLMFQGKKVLFTAQKQAALDVVRNNLAACSLEDYILEVFSIKASKKNVADSLGKRLFKELPAEPGLLKSYLKEQKEIKSQLNEYAELMGSEYGSTNWTVHEILWDIPDVQDEISDNLREFKIKEPEMIDQVSLESSLSELNYLKDLHSTLFQGKDNSSSPLNAIKKYIPNTFEIKDLEKKIRSLKPKLENLSDSKKRITDQSKDLISSEFEILNKKPFTEINKFIENQENGLWLRIVARDGSNNSILKYMKDLSRIQNEEREYKKRKEEIQTNFDLENLLFDEPEIKSSAKELIATNFLSFFDKAWWKARSVFNSLNKISNTNYPAKQKGKLLQELCSYLNNTKQQETSFDKTKSQLDEMKGSIESEDELLENFNEICNEVELKEIERQVNFSNEIPVSFRALWIENPSSVDRYLKLCKEESSLKEEAFSLLKLLDVNTEEFFKKSVEEIDIEELFTFFDDLQNSQISISDYMNWLSAERSVKSSELNKFYEEFTASELSIELLADVYKFLIRLAQKREIYIDHAETLRKYSGDRLKNLQQSLRRTDKKVRTALKDLIASTAHVQGDLAPEGQGRSGLVSNKTDKVLIEHVVTKPNTTTSVRDLFHKAEEAITSLKPCMLMSPLSVAQTLPLKELFDVVVIDEASQMPPEMSLGSLARAKQAVIVGDNNQLPPSTWFQSSSGEEDDDDYSDESILDMAMTIFYPPRDLKWHYRSKHEDLIKFSNSEFYQYLMIPVTANTEDPEKGVFLRYIENGFYVPKAKVNETEAKAMVEEIVKFMKERLNESLGVATMNQPQKELIENLMDQRRETEVLDYKSKWEETEGGLNEFFIKNLENVQGDERDTIMVGTVYGPLSSGGRVPQRFAGIIGKFGWRRLNVLFTRAKNQIILFTSLRPSDVLVDDKSDRSKEVFQKYLHFAETKQVQAVEPYSEEIDNPFQQWAIDKINSLPGFKAEWEVGVAGYRIDVGVKHDELPGYILAVETDGATWHSLKSARDRDVLRQGVLEDHGWVFHRIWSTDWQENPRSVFLRLKHALESRVEALKLEQEKRRKLAKEKEEEKEQEKLIKEGSTIQEEAEKSSEVIQKEYLEADISDVIEIDPGLFYDPKYQPRLKEALKHIINTEGPIEEELLVERVRVSHSWARAGNPIRKIISKAIPSSIKVTQFLDKNFFWPEGSLPEKWNEARLPTGYDDERKREPTQISPQEINSIARIILADHPNLPKSELAKKVTTLLGYSKCTSRTLDYMLPAFESE